MYKRQVCALLLLLGAWAVWNGAQAAMREQAAQSLRTAVLDAAVPVSYTHLNRRPPSAQGRIPWKNIGQALKDVGYDQ